MANALLAAYLLKRFLVDEFGPGATSLGTTGVERSWWLQHLRNNNRAAVWSTLAGLQYRQVVTWKHEVRTKIRGLLDHMGRTGRGNAKAQALLETLEALETPWLHMSRVSIFKISGKPDAVEAQDVNIGLDAWRKSLTAADAPPSDDDDTENAECHDHLPADVDGILGDAEDDDDDGSCDDSASEADDID